MKTIIISLCLFCFSTYGNAAGLIDTNLHPRPASPPTFDANHKAVDPTFGTTLLRVTGAPGSSAVYETTETQHLAPIQHFHNPWNCTGDMFLVWADRLSEGGGAGNDLYTMDKATFTVTRVRRIAAGTPSQMNYNRGIKWATDPNLPEEDRKWIVYAVDSSTTPNSIKKWNLDTGASHDGLAAGSSQTLLTDSEGISQLTVSSDDNRFSYYTTNRKVKVWVKSTDMLYAVDLSSWASFDESQITPDGQYVFIKGHQAVGDDYTARYDYTLASKVNYSSYSGTPPDDFAGKHSGHGEWWVNETSQSGYRLARRKPSAGKGAPESYVYTRPANGAGTMHPSYSTANYIYGGMFSTTAYNATKVHLDEILMIKTDGTLVTRLAHAWSNFFSNSYDEIPCYGSPDGRYVLFYSNWNGASPAARHDVFLIATHIQSIKNITF